MGAHSSRNPRACPAPAALSVSSSPCWPGPSPFPAPSGPPPAVPSPLLCVTKFSSTFEALLKAPSYREPSRTQPCRGHSLPLLQCPSLYPGKVQGLLLTGLSPREVPSTCRWVLFPLGTHAGPGSGRQAPGPRTFYPGDWTHGLLLPGEWWLQGPSLTPEAFLGSDLELSFRPAGHRSHGPLWAPEVSACPSSGLWKAPPFLEKDALREPHPPAPPHEGSRGAGPFRSPCPHGPPSRTLTGWGHIPRGQGQGRAWTARPGWEPGGRGKGHNFLPPVSEASSIVRLLEQ
nr:MAPK-interacting and spindle-stabilizing protein-like [Dasypus novemcinctus]